MECVGLTGINPMVIEELRKGIPRTIELTSAHNVISLANITPGSRVFMTHVDCEDIAMGDVGVLVEILSVTVMMKHVVEMIHGFPTVERERMAARCKVRYLSNSTIRAAVTPCRITDPRLVDVVKPALFQAK